MILPWTVADPTWYSTSSPMARESDFLEWPMVKDEGEGEWEVCVRRAEDGWRREEKKVVGGGQGREGERLLFQGRGRGRRVSHLQRQDLSPFLSRIVMREIKREREDIEWNEEIKTADYKEGRALR